MRTVTVVGGDLYRLALQHLGDATQWDRIVRLNRPTAPAPVAFYDIAGASWDAGGSYDAQFNQPSSPSPEGSFDVAGATWDSGGSYDADQGGSPLPWLDPVIRGKVTLKIPSVNPSATGGVLVL
jgi:hypothetical protein